MSGVGPIEIVILVTVMVMLFGPTLLAFWLGFTLGRKKGPASEKPAPQSPAPAEAPPAPAPAEAPPTPAPQSPAPPAPPETTAEQEQSDD